MNTDLIKIVVINARIIKPSEKTLANSAQV